MDWVTVFLESTVRMSVPIILASIGLVLTERVGILNIGVEGLMAAGAFFGYAGSVLTGKPIVGVVLAIVVTTLINTVCFGIPIITLRAHQAIVGTALNIMCGGLGTFLYRKFFMGGSVVAKSVTFSKIAIPGLSKIPFVGDALFNQTWYTYFAIFLVIVVAFLMKKTSIGNSIIAVGEYPKAAESLGISVIRYRYVVNAVSGVIFGIAGSMLSLNLVGSYSDSIVSGRGFIALAIVILGKYNAIGVLLGSLLFGFAQTLQMNMQIMGLKISYNLIMMIPYLFTIVAVVLGSRHRIDTPGALGVPYQKSK